MYTIHDELPHSFFSTTDNSNYLQCGASPLPGGALYSAKIGGGGQLPPFPPLLTPLPSKSQ